jgi:hypothetical protein
MWSDIPALDLLVLPVLETETNNGSPAGLSLGAEGWVLLEVVGGDHNGGLLGGQSLCCDVFA